MATATSTCWCSKLIVKKQKGEFISPFLLKIPEKTTALLLA
ncbi:excinuclease ABC, B subunit [Aggregatibacter aphrophilus NJ8700]|uniref:Excinuclease ABC subunit B n=1 Tax=Aggregatibacter aphrophilus TaxID=732 RepID=A0ABX9VX53_AGGAP|nr:excinuclease ABC, B subunit [Aggregatibacter aphrophilus NJ8700]PNL93193.1 excinuclease ABC subunit B [Aggregatibacter aphrophilus]RMW91431.1 excinuclease ABC subunit B [Aggregatibacter aphrophilus]